MSCNSIKNVTYLQDAKLLREVPVKPDCDIKLQPQDAVTIVVSSKDPKLAALFNLPRVSYRAGNTQLASYDSQISEYTIDSKGFIDFPVLGRISIAGYKREEVAELIKEKLVKENLVRDPVVTVEYVNLYFSIIGEVTKPGKYRIDRDRINIFEAISAAGDLTIMGKRDCVFIAREIEGKRIIYKVDFRSEKVFDSPAYYIRQGDIIYVQPNRVRANQSTINGNSSRNVMTWISIASVLTTLGVLIFK
jgi:polysaccharide export outer membrane protein